VSLATVRSNPATRTSSPPHAPVVRERSPRATVHGGARGSHLRGASRNGRRAPRPPVLDAVIVGGGPAGLSAALVLGRARRRVLVLDTDRPANAASSTVGGLLAHRGVSPAELRRAGREQLAEHPTVELRGDELVDAEPVPAGLAVTLDGGTVVRTSALVLAHGLRYDPPPLPGIEALWGRSVFHCPFCDGWEVRDRALAVHGGGIDAARSALLIAGWSRDVVLCTDGPARLNGEHAALAHAGVRVREEPIRELAGRGGRLERIEFAGGPAERCDALFVRTRRDQPNGLAAALGSSLTAGGTIVTDGDGRTGVPGVYAAGDAATEHSRSVANAIGSGSRAAYAVALDLVPEAGPAPSPRARLTGVPREAIG
jgi:thioredoxin reductase